MTRMTWCFCLSFGSVIMGITVASAQQSPPPSRFESRIARQALGPSGARPLALSLADLEGMAIGQNPSLSQAAAQIEQARGRAIQAGLYPNPTIGYRADVINEEGTAGRQGAIVQQQIVTAGKLRVNRARFEVEIQEAQAILAGQRYKVLNGVRNHYYTLLALGRQHAARAGLVRDADEVVAAVREKVETGHASRTDLLRAINEAELQRAELFAVAQRYRQSWLELATLIGQPGLPPPPLVGTLEADGPPLEWAASLDGLLRESPELRLAWLRVRRLQFTLRREQIAPIPNLTLTGIPQYFTTTNDMISNAQLSMVIPLWDRNQGNIRTAQGDLLDVRRDLERRQLALQNRLARTFADYQASRNTAHVHRETILPNASEAFRLALKDFRAEKAPYSTVNSVFGSLAQAHIRYLNVLLDQRRAEVAIRGQLVGDGGLDEPTTLQNAGRPDRTVQP